MKLIKSTYTTFFLTFLITVILLLLSIGWFNLIVDYTGIFATHLLEPKITLKTDNRRLVIPGGIRL